ncbi:MAG: hypothetical protein WAV51_02995 [Microgenomates group bacterium]
MRKNSKRSVLIFLLIVVSLCLRLYTIHDTTEFLGDQGRDGLAIFEAIEQRTLPVAGPTVGAGQYTGPLYYYLIAPAFVLFGFNPVVPGVAMCILSVAAILLFLYVSSSVFGFQVAYIVSSLMACSPLLIMQDRRLWNPTPIPFFVVLLITSLFLVGKKKKYWGFLTMAVSAAALLQLHYVNAISLIPAAIVCVGIVIYQTKKDKNNAIWLWIVGAVVLGSALVYPFLAYEAHHGFIDITGSFATITYGEEQVFSKRAYVMNVIEIVASLWKYVIALENKGLLLGIACVVLLVNLFKRKLESLVFVLWFCFGVCVLAFYKDTIQPQYWYQFIPVVFFLLVGVLSSVHKRIVIVTGIGIVVISLYVSWSLFHPYIVKDPDLPRITAITEKIAVLTDGQPFAFTVMNSRSFNDLHIRYFFKLYRILSVSIDDTTNNRLFIICENACPETPPAGKLSIMCSTEICPLDKPTVSFDEWRYEKTERVGNSALFLYTR